MDEPCELKWVGTWRASPPWEAKVALQPPTTHCRRGKDGREGERRKRKEVKERDEEEEEKHSHTQKSVRAAATVTGNSNS